MSDKESYGSRFLYSENLLINGEFKSPVVEISEVHSPGTIKSADGRVIDKWTIGFKGKSKLLVLCKTNASLIHFLTGYEPGDGWIGGKIKIQARIVKAFGEDTTAIRVMPEPGTTLRKKLIEGLGKPAIFNGNTK